jgi:hypothetical protein
LETTSTPYSNNDATTFGIMTLGKMTLCLTTHAIMTHGNTMLSINANAIIKIIMITIGKNDAQQNVTQHNGVMILSIMALSICIKSLVAECLILLIIILTVAYVECHFDECRVATITFLINSALLTFKNLTQTKLNKMLELSRAIPLLIYPWVFPSSGWTLWCPVS